MAFCPKCNGEMPTAAIRCPHCQFDFPSAPADDASVRIGFAYSPLADVSLYVSMLAAAIGACFTIVLSIGAISQGRFLEGLVFGPVAFFLQVGLLVTFLRVLK